MQCYAVGHAYLLNMPGSGVARFRNARAQVRGWPLSRLSPHLRLGGMPPSAEGGGRRLLWLPAELFLGDFALSPIFISIHGAY